MAKSKTIGDLLNLPPSIIFDRPPGRGMVEIPAEALRLMRKARDLIGEFQTEFRKVAPAALTSDLAEGLEPLLHAFELVDACPTAEELLARERAEARGQGEPR
jgi:hypothetical protein